MLMVWANAEDSSLYRRGVKSLEEVKEFMKENSFVAAMVVFDGKEVIYNDDAVIENLPNGDILVYWKGWEPQIATVYAVVLDGNNWSTDELWSLEDGCPGYWTEVGEEKFEFHALRGIWD